MDSDSGRHRAMDTDTDSDTVLELRMEKASLLKNVSEVLSELFSTANFKFSSTGLELQATDTSALVVLQLGSNAFDLYICNNDLSVRLNLADMAKLFGFANSDDIVAIKYQGGGKTITISLDSPGKLGTRTSFARAALCTYPVLISGLWK
jgi:proliferating cell nuclear antigen